MSPLARITAVIFAILVMAPLAFSAQRAVSTPERQLFEALNRERAALGLSMLVWNDSLASAARQHAERMAQHNMLSHQLPGEPDLRMRAAGTGARFSMVAENIAIGPDAAVIHSGWMHSPGHRANILSPELSAVGIAVVPRGAELFAVQDFSQAVPNLNLNQQEQQVLPLLAARGLQIIVGHNDARNNCDSDRGFAANRPALVARYETTNLKDLPTDLERKIQSGRYRAAAVGACSVEDARGFTLFRITILLY
jgi:hypothetical protein